MSFLNDVLDVGLSPIRGAVGFAEGVYNFTDFITGDALPDVEDNFGFGSSKTIAGGFIEEGVKFALGFVPAVGVAGKIGQVTGIAGKVAQAGKAAQLAAGAGKAVAAGAAVDFTIYEAHEERLSNLIQKIPALQNPITEYLAADENDSEIEGRLKNVLEGGILGGIADGVLHGVRALKKGRKVLEAGGTVEEADRAVKSFIDETPEPEVKETVDPLDPVEPTEPELDVRDAEGLDKGADAVIEILKAPKVLKTDKPSNLPLNIPRSSDIAQRQRVLKTLAVNFKDTYQESLKNPQKFSEVEELSEENLQKNLDEILLNAESTKDGGYIAFIKDLKERAASNAENIEKLMASTLVTRRMAQSASEILKEIAQKAKGGSDEDLARFVKAKGEMMGLIDVMSRESKASGRLLGSRRIVAKDSNILPTDYISREVDFSDEKSIVKILEESGAGDANKGRENIDKEIDEIINTETTHEVVSQVVNKSRFGIRLLTDYHMATILSGPTTHLVNAISNTVTALYLPAERALGAAVTGNKQMAMQEIGVYGHMLSSFTDALKSMSYAFKKGENKLDGKGFRDDAQKNALLEIESLRKNPDAPIHEHIASYAATALSSSSRALAASDGFFKTLTYNARLKSMLTTEGVSRGLKGEELAAFVAEKLERVVGDGQFYTYQRVRREAEKLALKETTDPDDLPFLIDKYMDELWDESLSPIAEAALSHAEYSTFTRSLTDAERGHFAKASGRVNQFINEYPLMRLVVPFVRTPVNLMTFVGERVFRSPLGALKTKQWADMPVAADNQRLLMLEYRDPDRRAEVMGRVVMGWGMMLTAVMAANAGNISGNGPSDPEKRRVLEASGWQPYSVRVGDKWISYRRFDPFSTIFGLVADMVEVENSDDGRNRSIPENLAVAAVMSFARNLANKSYLMGTVEFGKAIAEPDRYAERYFQGKAAAFVPFSALGGQINRGFDPAEREIRTVLDAMIARTPGGSETLDPRRNILGEVIERPNTPAGFLPFSYTEVKDDVILKEFAELGHGFSPPKPDVNGIDLTTYTGKNGRSAYDRWLELHGQVRLNGRTLRQELRRTIKSVEYQRLSPEPLDEFDSPRIARLRRIVGQYRREAFQQVLKEFDEIRDLDTKNTKINSLRRRGLTDRQIQSIINF